MSIQVKNLTKTYSEQKAVNNISFEARRGEILGFLGPNGAGKSTTMKIASGFLPPTSGEVKVSGHNVENESLEVRKKVGYLPENNPLYLDMYVHEYLHFIGSLHQMRGNHLKEKVNEMVGICGLSPEQNKKIGALSKGFRQRVGLAQSLLHDPEVLILDEPTTGLDPNQIIEIRQLIKRISTEKTVVFSTHILQEVKAICDRAVIIDRGEIVADSRISELKSTRDFEVIKLEFKHEVEVNPIRKLEGVLEVNLLDDGMYELKTSSGKDIRSEIFSLAAKHDWPLVGLQQVESSLEEVFKTLTQKGGKE